MASVLLRSAALLACALAAAAPHAANRPAIPVQEFFSNPAMTGASISPNGQFVAMRERSSAGRAMLTVINTATREQQVVANYSNADVSQFYWLSDQRLVYITTNVDHRGDAGAPGLYAVDRDGQGFSPLTEVLQDKRSFADSMGVGNAYLSEMTLTGFPLRRNESTLVVERSIRDKLMRINTRNGKRQEIEAPPGTFRWLVDPHGEIRVAVAKRGDDHLVFYMDQGSWRQLASFKAQSEHSFMPVIYVNGTLYVRANNGKDETAIYRYDLQKNALVSPPTITSPGYDASGYFLVGDSSIRGYRTNTDQERTIWFDAQMQAIQAEVDEVLPATLNVISYGAHSETPNVLVDSYSDVQDHIYILYNRDTKKGLRLGAATSLDPQRMAPMKMLRYPSRDGRKIPVFVTVPVQPSATPLPTVVLMGASGTERNVHWGWDAEVQFLASRGYVVLQPVPRGVSGFGLTHASAAGNPAAAQDDIADAVAWAAAQGYTDPARVCIAGTGAGGYAAMLGLLRNPATFKCGISWSGVTDHEDAGLSPLRSAARIKQPVLLAYGKEDEGVTFSEGRKLYEALARNDAGAEWLEYTSSVEDWKTQGNRIDLWRHIEAFLSKHIGEAKAGL
jgi:dipeptidyl aminopeptidase/acylaminoacyl peptidase